MLHQHHQKAKQKTAAFFSAHLSLFFFASKLTALKIRLRMLRLGRQQVYLFISMNTTADTQERRETHTLYWRMASWQCCVISGTWLYNWSLIDMKSGGLVLYTRCRPQAACAGSILVPSSDWCLCSKCPSTISTHNLSVSIRSPVYLYIASSTIHLSFLPLCLNVSLSLAFYLRIDLACQRQPQPLLCFSQEGERPAFVVLESEKWRVCLWHTGSHKRLHAFNGPDSSYRGEIKATLGEINFKRTFIYKRKWVTCSLSLANELWRGFFEKRE